MMATKDERILTLHPDGKQGVNIERAKYESMKWALLKVVPARRAGVAYRSLRDAVEEHLDPEVFGPDVSRSWYVTVVKQDLEAREMLEQVPGVKPQHLRAIR